VPKKIRNIAVFAHVDAGKTSLTENLLFLSGKIRQKGQVDSGNTQTDRLHIEKQRGISVTSGIVNFSWKNTQINLIDTPGHVDFSAETVRSIMAIDAAVVIFSSVEGIEAQSENMIKLLQKHRKPFIIFINKIDRVGADVENILIELNNDLKLTTLLGQSYQLDGDIPIVTNKWTENSYQNKLENIEKIVAQDDVLFEQYLSNLQLSFEQLQESLKKSVLSQQIIPVFLGSAKYGVGLKCLLNAIIDYLPTPELSDKLTGIVFKINHIKGEGKWAAVRLFGGKILARDNVKNASAKISEKVKLIKNTDIQQPQILHEFSAGDIAWVQGWQHAKLGDLIGEEHTSSYVVKPEEALLSTQILAVNPTETNTLVEAMQILHNEDPGLDFQYDADENELHLKLRGEIQKEIIEASLFERFQLAVNFTKPMIIYKETPTKIAEGFVRYWMPKPCWAIMKFKIEPGTRGSGVQFQSEVSINDIKKQYQKDVEKSMPKSLQQGILGWQVTDIKITLIEGEDHEVHTKSNDFAIATPMGIMDGLQKADMGLLEPILSYKIKTPDIFLGKISSELHKMRASIKGPEIINGTAKIWGEIPLATAIKFPIRLNALTSGKAKYNAQFSHYDTCDIKLGKTRAYKGISPLDTAKYILKARKALS